uniref:Uncharacterized protein n=1 Tax=Fagus sylvatica TaxID=28930 RepID=A0A2N9FRU3_FAGSY
MVRSRSDVAEPSPPPHSFPTFRFTSPSSDLDLYGWDLMEALGGSSFHQTLSLLSARLFLSSGCRDLLRPWMFGAPPHPNRMAPLVMANSIRLLNNLFG